MANNDFELKNLPIEAQDPSISADDFKFTNNSQIKEQKFQTKPTTFLKDSLKRFSKNKSSVVASVILGTLLVLSFLIPVVDHNDVKNSHPYMIYLEPKLFKSGTGFWDGTKKWERIPAAIPTKEDGSLDMNKENWWPNPERFPSQKAITNRVCSDIEYSDYKTKYGKEGYIQFGYYNSIGDDQEYVEYKSSNLRDDFDLTANNYVVSFDTYNEAKLAEIETQSKLPDNYVLTDCSLVFNFTDIHGASQSITLIDENDKGVHSIGSKCAEKEEKVNITPIINEYLTTNELLPTGGSTLSPINSPKIAIRIKNKLNHANTCVLIRSLEFSTDSTNEAFKNQFETASIRNATDSIVQETKISVPNSTQKVDNPAYWSSNGTKEIFMSKVAFCSFTYDSYEAVFGTRYEKLFAISDIDKYRKEGWLDYDFDIVKKGEEYAISNFYFEIKDYEKCPITENLKAEDFLVDRHGEVWYASCNICYYKYYGYTKMPNFLFGTDKSGRDMLKYVFEGLRTSLLLGILTTVVCFIFGLFYGSVSGYFGGAVDLVMERFTDILSGVPWIVVMTLVIIKFGTNFMTFALSLCLTGWIGTAATTRTQFYRFRGREYVLASRTLGASDARLIAKHILPNAMGTIITAAVLMIPSVIFSEATISYLGLGLKGMSSLGVILSNNQAELTTNPYLLIFPSVIIALLMISFNLFGNGLRDAVNPSLKGEGE